MSKARGFWHRKQRWLDVTRLMSRDGGDCTITLFEVVVTHGLDAGKLRKLAALCDLAEARGWRVRLMVAGRDAKYLEHDPRTGRMTLESLTAALAAPGGA